jgi:methyl-accepting chemotaxis protein
MQAAVLRLLLPKLKKLAGDSRLAAVEITQTVNSLAEEAGKFIQQIKSGADTSNDAQDRFLGLNNMMSDVSDSVAEVGVCSKEIAQSADIVKSRLLELRGAQQNVKQSNDALAVLLSDAHDNVTTLDINASRMFDQIVHSGMSPEDEKYVQLALMHAEMFRQMTQQALDQNVLSEAALFDRNYQQIVGSNPPRYRTRLTDWAESNWRPLFDKLKKENNITVICSAEDGFLPTHASEYCLEPIGDPVHDNAWCRNGIIVKNGVDIPAKASTADYMMAVYAHEGGTNQIFRSVYVPLYFNGRRWGDFELAYVL